MNCAYCGASKREAGYLGDPSVSFCSECGNSPRHDHLGTWTSHPRDDLSLRLDLWDTGRENVNGKSVLRYALALVPMGDARPTIFDGDDFCPSPLDAIDSDEAAGGLIGFFASYGESIRFYGDEADVPVFSQRAREALAAYYEDLSLWSHDLEGAE